MKIAIIGAGINGLYLAWKLAEQGIQVDVFEKKDKIGKEVCSGLFSENILKFIPQSYEIAEGKINSTLIHFPRKTIKLNFSEEFLIIEHSKLDKITAELAKKSGAKIFLGTEITEDHFPRLKKEYTQIIGCDGVFSSTRSFLAKNKKPKFRLAIQGFIPAEKKKNASVETWPVKNGFIWKIPKKNRCEYGAIGEPREIAFIFNQFLRKNNIYLPEKKSAPVPDEVPWFDKNRQITVCGDAAGLTKPWSGGGVVWGLIGADLLLQNFPNFIKYGKKARKFFLSRFVFSKIATKTVYILGFNFPWLIPGKAKIRGDFLV